MCMNIYYTFRFKKKATTNAEHKHNVADMYHSKLAFFPWSYFFTFFLSRRKKEKADREGGKAHRVQSPYWSTRLLDLGLLFLKGKRR